MTQLIIAIILLACAVFNYGVAFARLEYDYIGLFPEEEERRRHEAVIWSALIAILGPVGTFGLIMWNFWDYTMYGHMENGYSHKAWENGWHGWKLR